MHLIRILSLFVLLICLSGNATAQQYLFFRFTDGTQGIYPLQQVKHMDFANNQARLRLNDGTEYAWPITGVDHYKYTDIITSADEASPSADPWQVLIFPNPSSGRWKFESTDADELVSVHVFDIAGRAVDVHREGNFFEIHGPDGMYFVRVVTINGSNEMRCTYPLVISQRDK